MKVTDTEMMGLMIEAWNEFNRIGGVTHEKQREFRKKFHDWDGAPEIAEKVVFTLSDWGIDLNPPKTEAEILVDRIESVFSRCGFRIDVVRNELLSIHSEIIEMINRQELEPHDAFIVGKSYGMMCEMYEVSKDNEQ